MAITHIENAAYILTYAHRSSQPALIVTVRFQLNSMFVIWDEHCITLGLIKSSGSCEIICGSVICASDSFTPKQENRQLRRRAHSKVGSWPAV
jgi:hypothetical protein